MRKKERCYETPQLDQDFNDRIDKTSAPAMVNSKADHNNQEEVDIVHSY